MSRGKKVDVLAEKKTGAGLEEGCSDVWNSFKKGRIGGSKKSVFALDLWFLIILRVPMRPVSTISVVSLN